MMMWLRPMAVAMLIGAGAGVAAGFAFGNVLLGLALGLAGSVAVACAISRRGAQHTKQRPPAAEEIDLNAEDQAALDSVWKEIIQAKAAEPAGKDDKGRDKVTP
jgi:hypothetical protein